MSALLYFLPTLRTTAFFISMLLTAGALLYAQHCETKLAQLERKQAQIFAESALQQAQAAQKAKAIQEKQAKAFAELETRYLMEAHHAKHRADTHQAFYASGALRVFVPTSPAFTHHKLPNPTTYPRLDHAFAFAQLNPKIAAQLVRITEDGDAAIRQLTACQALLKLEREGPLNTNRRPLAGGMY